MEKRFFLAFLITFVFLLVWSRLMPQTSPPTLSSQETPEVGQIPEPPAEFGKDISLPQQKIEPISEELLEEAIGEFIITYSVTGGYIKEIAMAATGDKLPVEDIGLIPEDQNKKFTASISTNGIKFIDSQGRKKEFSFDGYIVTLTLTPSIDQPVVLFSKSLSSKMLDISQRYQEVFYSQKKAIKRAAPHKMKPSILEDVDFAGFRGRFYCLSLLNGDYAIKWIKADNRLYLYLLSSPAQTSFYVGPQTVNNLQPYNLQGIIYYGFFHVISLIMIKILYFLHSLTKNWGLSIIGFSVAIYFALFPFTAKSMKAMRRIQQVQPELEALKEKYKDNQQKLNKEIMEFYKKNKINPLGGCLPLFFQFPVFIALYQVIFRFFELKGAKFLWISDLSLPDRLCELPFTIPLLKTNQLNILPILVMVLGLAQQKITASSSSNSQQKTMGMFMSVFIGFIFYGFPSALVLYWFTQNLLTLVYQSRIAKSSPAQS